MALLEFVDRSGNEWRAWNITPEDMHPVTAREMFVGESADFQEGWLVFESAAGERRRLAPYPAHWSKLAPRELEILLDRATRVVTHSATNVQARPTTGELRRFENTGTDAPREAAPRRRAVDQPGRGPDERGEQRRR